jgi:rod shape-determining protein MreC
MNNLLQFVIRYSAFILFLLLEAAALTLVVKYNDNQKGIFQHSSSLLVGRLYKLTDEMYKYNHLQTFADSLADENALLKEQIFNLERSVQRLQPVDQPIDSCILDLYHLIPAQVINNSINQRNNHFTIDKGTRDGIQQGMGVISQQGIVGIIEDAGTAYSTAVSILHSGVQISAAIKRNGYFGTMVWKEIDPAHIILEAIPGQADIQIGDTIVTSGYSYIFPKGIFIGKIDRFWTEGGSNYYTIQVRLHEDIARMNRVYVVEYLEENVMTDE